MGNMEIIPWLVALGGVYYVLWRKGWIACNFKNPAGQGCTNSSGGKEADDAARKTKKRKKAG